MNLRKEIKQAYQQIRVPADVSEHLKQELYQKDFQEEEFTEIFQTEELSKSRSGSYFGFIAAALVLGIGIGSSVWSMMANRSEEAFHPSSTVPAEITVTETTEETTAPPPDA